MLNWLRKKFAPKPICLHVNITWDSLKRGGKGYCPDCEKVFTTTYPPALR